MKKYALALDLKDDPRLIEEYIQFHKNVWPEIRKSIVDSGIHQMEIFHVETRLFMLIEAADDFSFERKTKLDIDNEVVQKWETLMNQYKEKLPFAKAKEKWVLMDKIFEL